MTEFYKCLDEKCQYEFTREFPGPIICPKCKNLYVKWVNFYIDWECDERGNWNRKDEVKDESKEIKKET